MGTKKLSSLVLSLFVCLSLFATSTGQSQITESSFDTTLTKWLAYVGFSGDILEYQKVYDADGFIDYFRIMLEEKKNETKAERTQTKLFLEVTDNEAYEFLHVKMIEKDIKDLPYMYADWIARFAISHAIKKVSKLMGLQAETEEVKNGLYRVTIDPAKATEPSRYRFTQIEVFYEVHDLFLSLDVTIKGAKDYLILSFLKSELHGILRALENGNFPGSTSEILISGLLKGSSDHVVHDLLKVPEASREILLKFEGIPESVIEGLKP